MSHSPLDSCVPSFEGRVTLLSGSSRCLDCVVTSAVVAGSSYPTARMLIAYSPGSSLSRGKLYWPSALLTTHVVIVEPAFFAPTRTPSIAPSACEVTLPVSADGRGVCAVAAPAEATPNKAATRMIPRRRVPVLMATLRSFQAISNRGFAPYTTPVQQPRLKDETLCASHGW